MGSTLAADARSVLACPATVSMVVDGETQLVGADHQLGLTDQHGVPTFVCTIDSPVARAAETGRNALLTLTSGLGPRGSAERADTLTLAGRLARVGIEDCDCCGETRQVVALELDLVVLARADRQHRVPPDQFRSPAHHLNRGHLQRSVEHANDCHQDELRQAVALGTGTHPGDLLGVHLAGLTPSGVEIQWVDVDGAHRSAVSFPRTASSLDELGGLLCRGLHAGLC